MPHLFGHPHQSDSGNKTDSGQQSGSPFRSNRKVRSVGRSVGSTGGRFTDARKLSSRQENQPDPAGKPDVRPKIISFSQRQQEQKRVRSRLIIRRVLVFIGILAVLAATVWSLFFSPLLALRAESIQVRGSNEWVTEQQVAAIASQQKGRSLLLIDSQSINEQVAAIPGARGATVSRNFPHGITVTVSASKPAAILCNSAHATEAVDSQGRVMTGQKASTAGIPLINVSDFSSALKNNAVKQALKVLAALPDDMRSQITSVTARTQDSVITVLRSGFTIMWGNSSQMSFKIAIVQRTMAKLTEEKSDNRVIDVSAPDYPIAKKSLGTK